MYVLSRLYTYYTIHTSKVKERKRERPRFFPTTEEISFFLNLYPCLIKHIEWVQIMCIYQFNEEREVTRVILHEHQTHEQLYCSSHQSNMEINYITLSSWGTTLIDYLLKSLFPQHRRNRNIGNNTSREDTVSVLYNLLHFKCCSYII